MWNRKCLTRRCLWSNLRNKQVEFMKTYYRAFIGSVLVLAVLLSGCAVLPDNAGRDASYAFNDTEDTSIGKSLEKAKISEAGRSGFILLGSGLDAFVARALLAEKAERSIDAQYYLWHNDTTGKLLLYFLIRAADRGVRVRLLVDDMDLGGRDVGAVVLDSHPNIEVRLFNPFSRNQSRAMQFLTRYGSVTRRMHNKSFTVDNQAVILGGRNIGDEYFEANPDVAFSDLDVIGFGPVARNVSESFDQYWNSELAYPAVTLKGRPATPEEIEKAGEMLEEFFKRQETSAYIQALKNSNLANSLRNDDVKPAWGEATVIYDKPEKIIEDKSRTEYHLSPHLEPFLRDVHEEFIVFSPYFVPGREGVAFFKDLVEKGVRVRILTNSLSSTDVGVVHAGYSKYRKDLLQAGVELYEMNKKISSEERMDKKGPYGSSKASLHAKSFVFDRERVFIGSLNLDPRSFVENTEIGVVISSREIAEGMSRWFDENISRLAFKLDLYKDKNGYERIRWYGLVDGKPYYFYTDPYTGFWRRFGVGFMGLLPIESQL